MPSWHSDLKLAKIVDIERIQRIALNIILSDFKTKRFEFSYDMSLVILDIEPLSVRRDTLCLTFAKKTAKRCFYSSMNYLTRLLNAK